MNFLDFLKTVGSVTDICNNLDEQKSFVNLKAVDKFPVEQLESLFIEKNWVSGGSMGRSCYGTKAYSVSSEDPEDITPVLAKVLKAVGKENMNFLTYVSDVQPLIKTYEFSTKPDWYSNYYKYSRVYVNLKELYDVLYGNDV